MLDSNVPMVAAPSERNVGSQARTCPTCGTSYPADFLVCPKDASTLRGPERTTDPWVGRVLADTYQIVSQLAEGGMGRVFQARHLRLPDRYVAVKVLGEDLMHEPEIIERFDREVESVSRVVHPHVIEIYDAGKTADGVRFFVTELLDGEDLGARIERTKKPLPTDLAVNLTRQLCLALEAAHGRGIVHRDVKPENVFVIEVDKQPFVKVLDFGISKVAQKGQAKLTRTGAVLGTPAYMAPEQARGTQIDVRTDVYGVGATLYTALAGKAPYEEEDAATALSKLLSEEPPRLRAVAPHVPAELELVVQRAMSRDPRDRYESARALADALAPFDSTARAMAASASSLSRDAASQPVVAETPRGARLAVLFYAMLLGVFWIAGASTAAAAVVRHARHAKTVTSTDSALVLFGVGLATFLLSASVLSRTREAWPNSVRIMELLADRRRTVFFGLATYAIGCIVVRFGATFLTGEEPAEGFDMVLDVAVFSSAVGVAILVAALAWLARGVARFRRR